MADVSIARAGRDAVCVVYPTATKVDVVAGVAGVAQSTLALASAQFSGTGVTATVHGIVKPTVASASTVNPTFVEYDQTLHSESGGRGDYPAALYWVESDPVSDTERIYVEKASGVSGYSPRVLLDKWKRLQKVDSPSLWDYFNGTSYCGLDHTVHFVPVWGRIEPVTFKILPVDGVGIGVGDVTVGRPCDPATRRFTPPIKTGSGGPSTQ